MAVDLCILAGGRNFGARAPVYRLPRSTKDFARQLTSWRCGTFPTCLKESQDRRAPSATPRRYHGRAGSPLHTPRDAFCKLPSARCR